MTQELYLDTARLGRMTLRSQAALIDFTRFAAEQGASLYLSDFFQEGADVWPERLRQSYPGLCDWQGVGQLKECLKTLAQAHPESEVVLAARSVVLMRVGTALRTLQQRFDH